MGILISQVGSNLKMVATDSYRLAVSEFELDQASSVNFEAVISGPFLQDIASLASSNDPVTLALSENQIVVTYHNATFINRRIEGQFPNYKQLLSDSYTTTITLSRSALNDAIRRVSLLSNKVSPIQISVDAEAGIVTLISNSQDVGNAQESIVCDVEGESVDIAFNYNFMLEGLGSIQSEEITFNLLGAMKPGVLRSTGEEKFLYLIMPVRF
jgi:DNA polymerase-3 subunit beta